MDILAQDGTRGWVPIIIVIVVMGLSILVKVGEKLAQKAAEQKAEEQRRRREAAGQEAPEGVHPAQQGQQQARREPYAPAPGARPQPQQPAPQEGARRYPPMPQPQQPIQPGAARGAPQPVPPQRERRYPPMPQPQQPAQPGAARGVPQPVPPPRERRYPPAPQPGQPVQPGVARQIPRAAPPQPLPPPLELTPSTESLASGVEGEMAQLQSRLAKLERVRRRRLTAATPEEADTAAIEARLVSIHPTVRGGESTVEAVRAVAAVTVDLTDRRRARAAIVFHEILSPPKGIRSQPEMWEM